ncbi:2,3-butanediol dehydrogenase [Salicibibacter kimchii]|uniref:Butanediol dehydrogenase n=1 Tax=Salicibibacter kimchii TaxID=2099786 RepID=A0A345BWD1_9BACI|nr:2,3-butanediol dehydrogenase [Salicibibacter kimchii]AXF55262.1 butanediol dehydrogenase [Salicibibacter kimchii]
MKAAVIYGEKELKVQDIDVPEVTDGKVKVKVEWAGICGSDLHIYHHGAILSDEEHPLSGRKPPVVLGHEFAGTVTEIGKNVFNVAVGDNVAIEPLLYCGTCEMCKKGNYHICEISNTGSLGVNDDGGFAEYVVTDAYHIYKLPQNVTLEEGALIEPMSVAHHAVKRSGLKVGQSAAIFGAGPIGLLTLLSAEAAGASETFVIDVSQERLDKAKEMGATYTINPTHEDAVDKIMQITGKGVDVAYEAAGAQPTFVSAIQSLKRAGTITVVAVFGNEITFDSNIMFGKEASMQWSAAYPNSFSEVINLISSGKLDVKQVITKRIKLDDIVKDGLDLLAEDKSQAKILVSPN